MKQKFDDPFIVLGGDFNQWPGEQIIVEFPDVSEVDVGSMRGDRSLDRIFCNLGRSMESCGTVPPLETDHSLSDHRIAYFVAALPRREAFEWITYSYRLCTEEAKKDFGSWLVMQDWSGGLAADSPDDKVN